nr:MAG TPA: hypothetical protein [Caudoviricetes sp.]
MRSGWSAWAFMSPAQPTPLNPHPRGCTTTTPPTFETT